MEPIEKHIFVSHYHADAGKITDLISLIEKNGQYVIRDSSNYEDKSPNSAQSPAYIEQLIRPQMEWAGTIIVLIGQKTKESDWVDWEINFAGRHDKKIIGVFLPGSDESDIPEAFKTQGSALCSWDSELICKALATSANEFEKPNGSPADSPIGYPLSRFNC